MKDKVSPGRGAPRDTTQALIDLDKEMMKLLVRRTILVSRLREGKRHASSPAAVQAEKAVRLAFEANASAFSKDPRFTGKFFALVQDLTLLSREDARNRPGFVLSPPRKPVNILGIGPTSGRSARLWMALAAMSGAATVLSPLMPCEAARDCVKVLNQAGGKLEWQSDSSSSLTVAAGRIPSFAGRTLFVGDDLLTLYLACFMAVRQPGILRLTGGPELKEADLSGLRHILPLLGARLAHLIPHSQSLPATLECSGALPDSLDVPEDLPLEGMLALLLAPITWGRSFTCNLSRLPASTATTALTEMCVLFTACEAEVEVNAPLLIYGTRPPRIPEHPVLPLDPVFTAYLLALPAFAGGRVSLKGTWPAHLPEAQEALHILNWAGLRVDIGDGELTAVPITSSTDILPPEDPYAALSPLTAAVFVRDMRRGRGTEPSFAPEIQPLIQSFFSCLRLEVQSPRSGSAQGSDADKSVGEGNRPRSWICPDACWGMALALASFVRPGVRLANPDTVTQSLPFFWTLFNSLPEPDPAGCLSPSTTSEEKDSTRRRIRTDVSPSLQN
ncbi:MAG: hypothetical protein LBO77_08810 [Desulfovibrio sp.]|jgi:5-enolpyruvylshikimate-3-phosphate synthase|nr:hypothetical protein [Desulfovibrio sp.]